MVKLGPEDDPSPPAYMVWGTKVEALKLEGNSKNVNVELTVVRQEGETLAQAIRRARALGPEIQAAVDMIKSLHTAKQ